jgi:hypothetical protein
MALSATTRSLSNRRPLTQRNFPVAAGVRIFEGALVVLDNTGYARPARASTTDVFVGRAIFEVDNTGGAAGAVPEGVEVEWDMAIRANNSASSDAIAITDIGKDCFLVDDNTVALTNGSSTRVKGGKIWQVTADGVWIRPEV